MHRVVRAARAHRRSSPTSTRASSPPCTARSTHEASNFGTTAVGPRRTRRPTRTAGSPLATTDALQLFLKDIDADPLLTAAEEVALAKRVERGDKDAKDKMVKVEPASGRLDRERGYQGARPHCSDLDPGRGSSDYPRGREVRLASGLQVLYVLDLVDSSSRGSAASRTRLARFDSPVHIAGSRAEVSPVPSRARGQVVYVLRLGEGDRPRRGSLDGRAA